MILCTFTIISHQVSFFVHMKLKLTFKERNFPTCFTHGNLWYLCSFNLTWIFHLWSKTNFLYICIWKTLALFLYFLICDITCHSVCACMKKILPFQFSNSSHNVSQVHTARDLDSIIFHQFLAIILRCHTNLQNARNTRNVTLMLNNLSNGNHRHLQNVTKKRNKMYVCTTPCL